MMSNSKSVLFGKRIIITRSQDQQVDACRLLSELGAQVLELPALIIGPPDDWEPLDKALLKINEFDWIIFSSINGVKNLEERIKFLGLSLNDSFRDLKVAAVGRKTASYLNDLGIKINFVPPNFVADSLINNFPKLNKGAKLLIPRVQSGGRKILVQEFQKLGVMVVEVPAYESRCPNSIPSNTINAINNQKIDVIAFTSGKTVFNTAKLMSNHFGDQWLNIFKNINIVSIGPQTSLICLKVFSKVDKEAEPHDLEGLIKACIGVCNN